MTVASPPRRPGRHQAQAPALDGIDGQSRDTVERQVYRSIRLGLMSGLFRPGETLTSRSLAHELKVSAQPVRDALKRLEADGVLRGKPQSGFLLPNISQGEYREITEIRQRLEGLAGRHSAATISEVQLAELERLNAGLEGQLDPKSYLARNYRFHFLIYAEARRPNLLALIENFWVRIGPALHHYPKDVNPNDTVEKHRIILRALRAHDPDLTEAAIAHDLGDAADHIVPHLPADDLPDENRFLPFVIAPEATA